MIRAICVLVSVLVSLGISYLPVMSAETMDTQDVAAIVGKPAPNFELHDYKGDTYSLSKYKGKFVVLEWVNFVCPFSRKHYESGNMPSLQKEYVKKGVIWLSINSSAPGKQGNFPPEKIKQELKAFLASPTAYLIDPEGRVGHLYSAKTTPAMYIINPKGILVYKGAIDNKPTTDKDDIPGANNYVKAALEAAMANKPIAISQTRSYGCSVKYAE